MYKMSILGSSVYLWFMLLLPSLAPSAAPDGLTIVERRSRSTLLKWLMPPREGRNGIIIQYRVELFMQDRTESTSVRNIEVSVKNSSFNQPSIITLDVTDLTPFTDYSIRMAAVNDAGVGPFDGTILRFKTNPDCE